MAQRRWAGAVGSGKAAQQAVGQAVAAGSRQQAAGSRQQAAGSGKRWRRQRQQAAAGAQTPAARLTTRRGWVTPIMPCSANPASSRICDICVVLPLPVSPITTVTGLALTESTICCWYCRMGSLRGSIAALRVPD